MTSKKRRLFGLAVRSWAFAVGSVILLPLAASYAWAQADNPPWYEEFGSSVFKGAATPVLDLSESFPLLKGLSVSGFLENETGMWANSANLVPFGRQAGEHHGANSLAVERNWAQVDFNYILNPNNRFFLRFWGVYEPPYPFENHGPGGLGGNGLDKNLVYDRGISEFYNRYDIRDAFYKGNFGPLTLFLGSQIVTWGESVAFRVGDVINPQDVSWAFGFANLEQSRLPVWMVHPIYGLPDVGPLTSNFVEGVWIPSWQPRWTSVRYPNDQYADHYNVAGAVGLTAPYGGRFDFYPYNCTIPGLPQPFCFPGEQPAFPQVTNLQSPFLNYRMPSATWANSMEGFRLHTLLWNAEITGLFWHGHQLFPTTYVAGDPTIGQYFQLRYAQLNDVGVTMNRPLYLPGVFSNVPLVLRTEGLVQDRTPFNTVDAAVSNSVVDKTTLNTLVAIDNDGMPAPWLTRTGTVSTTLEWQNYSILSSTKNLVYDFYGEHWRHDEENLLLSAGTSWYWGAIAPTLTGIYNPDGSTFLLFPNTVLTPPWTNKYFLSLLYIGIISNDKYSSFAGGTFKGKSILMMQFQYNFELARGS